MFRARKALSVLSLAVLFVSGCAGPQLRDTEPVSAYLEAVGECARFFDGLDEAVRRATVGDAEAARISGFPYLRVNRFLAFGLAPDPRADAFSAWVDRLQRLDREARAKEIANLPADVQDERDANFGTGAAVLDEIHRCGNVLRTHDLSEEANRQRLLESAKVPASYNVAKRVVGLYPLTSLFFLQGVRRLQADIASSHKGPLEAIDIVGELTQFRPHAAGERLEPAAVAELLRRSSRNPLGIPEPTGGDRERLFASFAPVWEVDVNGEYDLIGTPQWNETAFPAVDVTRPAVFRRLSHTRYGGKTLLQLNYVVWFASRPRSGAFDLLGGRLDGLIWRVTLAPDGRPLMYDAVHNCGCYHMFFPTERVRPREEVPGYEEPVLVVQALPADAGPLRLRIASGTHYIQRVYVAENATNGRDYQWREYQELRSLPLPQGGRRSLFRSDGIVPGTERGERWLFWPMGVAEPGSMRQWGTHAIAFVGRRHFDDPDLLERYFQPVTGRRFEPTQ
jgi:hypothetical protein